VIVVLARVPVPGAAKTRLIPALGAEGAARVAAAMAADVLAQVRACGVPFRVEVAGQLEHPWVRSLDVPVAAQPEGDLGTRIAHALREGGLVIGTDCVELTTDRMLEGLAAVGVEAPSRGLPAEPPADMAIAPAQDGGYVLVGLRRGLSAREALFRGVSWSSPDTLSEQLARARALGVSCRLLPGSSDVDTPADLAALRSRLILLPPTFAPATRACLESLDAAALR
jgi:rSAM/selenodomain-associated transferase 1